MLDRLPVEILNYITLFLCLDDLFVLRAVSHIFRDLQASLIWKKYYNGSQTTFLLCRNPIIACTGPNSVSGNLEIHSGPFSRKIPVIGLVRTIGTTYENCAREMIAKCSQRDVEIFFYPNNSRAELFNHACKYCIPRFLPEDMVSELKFACANNLYYSVRTIIHKFFSDSSLQKCAENMRNNSELNRTTKLWSDKIQAKRTEWQSANRATEWRSASRASNRAWGTLGDAEPNSTWSVHIFSARYDIISAACKNGNIEILKFLQETGFTDNKSDNACCYIACRIGHLEILKIFIKSVHNCPASLDKLYYIACKYGNRDIVEYLICKYKFRNNVLRMGYYHAQSSGYDELAIFIKNSIPNLFSIIHWN